MIFAAACPRLPRPGRPCLPSGCRPAAGVDARPCFEFYPEDAFFDPATGEFSCQICLAVRLLNS